MRYMTIVKADENQGVPPQALIDAIMALGADDFKSGRMLEMGGLLPTETGARVRIENGKISVMDGPFSESKEVIGGFAIHNLKSKAEAIEATKAFLELHRIHWPEWVGEVEVRPMYDEGDSLTA